MTAMGKNFRNLLLAALAAAFCFGGSFVCVSHSDDGKSAGVVAVNP